MQIFGGDLGGVVVGGRVEKLMMEVGMELPAPLRKAVQPGGRQRAVRVLILQFICG